MIAMKSKTVNIIIPCYNVENYIEYTIASLQNQTHKNFRVICIDDHSADKTFSILNNLKKTDDRIECYRNEKNYGVVETLNKLIALCDAEWIIRMDSDDIFEPQRIELLLKIAQEKGLKVVSTFYSFIDMNNVPILEKRFLDLCTQDKSIRYMAIFNSPFPSQALFHYSVLEQYKYEKRYKVCEDYYHFVSILENENFKVGNIDQKLYKYRINTNGLSVNNEKLMRENHLIIARDYVKSILGLKDNEAEFLKIGLKLFDYTTNNKVIIDALKQCFEIERKFKEKYDLSKEELVEIHRYTRQYFIFILITFLKSPASKLDKFYILSHLIPIITSILTNKEIMKWILKSL